MLYLHTKKKTMHHLEKRLRVVAMSLLVAALCAQALPTHADAPSSLRKYGLPQTYCGTEAIPQDITTIPWIGCFTLSADHSATGTFSNHQVEVAVDANGEEVFTVDGTVITTIRFPQRASETNVPYVHVTSSGYGFCDEAGAAFCPSSITVFSRNSDRSVLFMVAECLPPTYRVCVLTQQNWLHK